MSLPAITRAPEVCELINRINHILTRDSRTRDWFRVELNRHLPPSRHIKPTHGAMVQLYRWLDPTSRHWSEPKGEVVLAMKQFTETFS